jgi:hypothetical protein
VSVAVADGAGVDPNIPPLEEAGAGAGVDVDDPNENVGAGAEPLLLDVVSSRLLLLRSFLSSAFAAGTGKLGGAAPN